MKNKHINNTKYPRAFSVKFPENLLGSGVTMFVPQEDWHKLEKKYNKLMQRYLKLLHRVNSGMTAHERLMVGLDLIGAPESVTKPRGVDAYPKCAGVNHLKQQLMEYGADTKGINFGTGFTRLTEGGPVEISREAKEGE